MKIVHVIPVFNIGGAERMAETLCLEQKYLGAEVFAISLYSQKTVITENLERNGIKVYFLNKKRGLDFSIKGKLVKIFKDIAPDVVHTHLYVMKYAVPAAIKAKVKVRVHTVHNIASKELSRLDRMLAKWYYKRGKSLPVSISPLIQQSIMKEYGLSSIKTPMIYNGSDLSKFIKKSSYAISGRPKILHIGRLSNQKNHFMILDAIRLIIDKGYDFEFQFIGDGELKEELLEKTQELRLIGQVSFLGIKEDVTSYLTNADIFMLPSKYEGMPITLIEAMASALPIIATKVGGIPDMIKDNFSGILIDDSAEQLAESIIALASDEKLRARLGAQAKEDSKKYSAKQMVEGYSRLYEGKQ